MPSPQVILVREHFEVPSRMTDAQVEEILTEATDLVNTKVYVVAGNMIEQREVADEAMKDRGKSWSDLVIDDWEAHARDITELLFREGFYGPSCVWARALLEYILQDDVILHAEKSPKLLGLKQQIEKPGRNPGIEDMIKALMNARVWTVSDQPHFERIKDNGDWVIHHRYDMTTGGAMASKYKFGFALVTFGVDGVKKVGNLDRKTLEFNRSNEERRLAKESLAALYALIISRRSKQNSR